jgi:hypothetical protein
VSDNEKLIKVHLPGESLWAAVTGKTDDGRTKAELRNRSVHGIPWGTAVTLGIDGYTVVEPREIVEQAQRSVDGVRTSKTGGNMDTPTLPLGPEDQALVELYACLSCHALGLSTTSFPTRQSERDRVALALHRAHELWPWLEDVVTATGEYEPPNPEET